MRDRSDSDAKKGPSEPARRKPYRTPRLERLGTLTEITAAVGTTGKNDMGGGPSPIRKTH
jgi:hypothetical protein